MRGEVFLRASFLKDVLVDFLFCESSIRMFFMKVFLWRVRFWLRMNAGGVLNTCKSNEALNLISSE